jgi:hypothetical protein
LRKSLGFLETLHLSLVSVLQLYTLVRFEEEITSDFFITVVSEHVPLQLWALRGIYNQIYETRRRAEHYLPKT